MTGGDVVKFWDLTLEEITIVIKCYNQKEDNRAKELATLNYNLAEQIASFTSLLFNGKKIPKIEELYPSLFAIDTEEQEKKEIENYKAQFLQFALNHNKSRK